MRVLLLRPPRLTWAHVDEESNNILPLAYPCLAAYLRERLPEVRVTILDCNMERMSWKSLREYLKENAFDVVGLGSETIYVPHDRQALRWVREYHPESKIIVGGRHYPFNPHDAFDENLADFIVKGEGEVTFCELLRSLMSGNSSYDSIAGLIWKDEFGNIHDTGWREPVPNLDDLPIPAYDMVPTEEYARRSAFFPNGITIEHSRGCDMGCTFCTFWPQMARWEKQADGRWVSHPLWRTKSVERALEEARLLVSRYKKEMLWFIDGTFAVDLDWTARFADAVLREGLKFYWFIFERAQNLVALEKMGALEKMIRAGLRHVIVGAEHPSRDVLASLGKDPSTPDLVREAVSIFNARYPEVLLHLTYMGGAPSDDRKSLNALYRYATSMKVDVTSLHFLTPMPGTALYDQMKARGKIKVFDYTLYNWFNPVMETEHLTIAELDKYWGRKFLTANMHHPLHKIKRFFAGDKMTRRILRIGAIMAIRFTVKNLLMRPFRRPGVKFRSYVKPKWFDN